MKTAAKVLLASIVPAMLAGCGLGQIRAVLHPTITGEMNILTADAAPVRWAPDRCASGDWNYFLGFDFSSAQDHEQLRVIKDPAGDILVRWTSQQASRVFHTADCSRLEFDIQPTGWRVNEVREFAGRVELQCRSPDGGSIEGRLTVDHCH